MRFFVWCYGIFVCFICDFSWLFFLRKTQKGKPIPARSTECHWVFWRWTFIPNAAEWSLGMDLLTEQNIILHVHHKALELQVRRLEKFCITDRFSFRSTRPAIRLLVLGFTCACSRWIRESQNGWSWEGHAGTSGVKSTSDSRFSLGRWLRTSEYRQVRRPGPVFHDLYRKEVLPYI